MLKLNSRHFLRGISTLVLLLLPTYLLPCEPVFAQTTQPSDAQILHLLNRVGFGPSPGDIESIRRQGIDAYLEKQLRPEMLPRSSELDSRLAELTTLNTSMQALVEAYGVPPKRGQAMSEDERKELKKRQHIIVHELSEAKILRAIASPAQLQEVMVDFWFNHFNVFAQKGPDNIFVSSYERDAIRPYALGKFRDLLNATAHHPAMLVYLDNWQNTDPDSILAQRAAVRGGKKIGINENYAREIMELHTLGVKGGYTQQDVTTLAQILTGWGLGEGQGMESKAVFYFEPRRHDFSNKTWLGYNVQGGGPEEIETVLDILAKHPATAHHIAYQLAQYFVADEPPKTLVDKLASVFTSSGGDIPTVLRTLFHSQEFWDPQNYQTKFKPPFRYVVSAFRAVNIMPPGDTKMLQGTMAQWGEPLYHCQTPNGYANANDQWLNSDALLKRIDFAKKVSDRLGPTVSQTIINDFSSAWSSNTLSTVQKAEPQMKAALLLGSPEFVNY